MRLCLISKSSLRHASLSATGAMRLTTPTGLYCVCVCACATLCSRAIIRSFIIEPVFKCPRHVFLFNYAHTHTHPQQTPTEVRRMCVSNNADCIAHSRSGGQHKAPPGSVAVAFREGGGGGRLWRRRPPTLSPTLSLANCEDD